MIPGLQGAVSKNKFAGAYVASYNDATNLATYTFAGCSLGTPGGNRLIVVGVGNQCSTAGVTINSVTIGGVAATRAVTHNSAGAGLTSVTELWYAFVPLGATGDVVVTHSATAARCAISIWRIANARYAAPFATGGVSGGNGTTCNANIDIPADGFAIAFSRHGSATTGTLTNITEVADFQFDSDTALAGSDYFASAQTARNITATYGETNYLCMALASWR